MATRDQLDAGLTEVGGGDATTSRLWPTALIGGAWVRADAPISLDELTGGPPTDRPPPTAAVEGPLGDLASRERSVMSQNGEDGVLEAIFATIGATNKVVVEFGCGNALECNTAHLIGQGWTGLLMDPFHDSANPQVEIQREFVTAENIEGLLATYDVPASFDLLSIDIDGNDLWVWKGIARRPRVVVIECNSHVSPLLSRSIPYDPDFQWDGTDQHGASLLALDQLARRTGYALVHVESRGVNAFFVADESLPEGFIRRSVADLHRPPDFLGLGLAYPSSATPRMIDPFADELPPAKPR
jgi:hypothetical protein